MVDTILIVDDNAMNLKLVRVLLEKAGYKVIEAKNGEQSVELAKKVIPDLILMDIQMPVMDGTTALNAILEIETTRDIPVIALTSYAMKGDQERFLSEGFVGYISKPIDIKMFVTLIENIMKQYHG